MSESHEQQIERLSKELEQLNEEAGRLAADEPAAGAEIVPLSHASSAQAARAQLAAARSQATRVRDQIASKAKELREAQRAQVRALEQQMAARVAEMERMLEPLQEQLAQLEEAVWTVNLYLGRDEQIVRLAEGAPAPASEPVVIRQLVLAMDEECAASSEHGGIDALDIEQFDRWLTADPRHLSQVLPEQKGVVALVPRYWEHSKDYGNPRFTAAVEEANRQTYFLIRNGENVYRTWTDFEAGRNLIPRTDEFTRLFESRDRETGERTVLEPGSEQWLKAERRAQRTERHFMRVALILEGLLHRTTVFHPLPPQGVSFLDRSSHADGNVRFVLDAEAALGSGREPFFQWLSRLNAQLRPGMRVVANFRGLEWREANDFEHDEPAFRRPGHSRVRPHTAQQPSSELIYRIEERTPAGELLIRYQRQDEVWVQSERYYGREPRQAKRRASVILKPSDRFIVPIDLVSEQELIDYLSSRAERHTYVAMFPVLKSALRAIRAEREAEAPFREMLCGVLARENGVSVEQAREQVGELVSWWKLANRHHRPLLAGAGQELADEQIHEAKAVRGIVAEHRRRLAAARRGGASDEIVARLRSEHPDAVLIARKRSGSYVVFCPEDQRNVHVRQVEYGVRGAVKSERRWVLPPVQHKQWERLYADERWNEWDLTATAAEHLTGPEIDQLARFARHQFGDRLCALTRKELDTSAQERGIYEAWALDLPEHVNHADDPDRATRPEVPAWDVSWRRKRDGVTFSVSRYNKAAYSWAKTRDDIPWHDDSWRTRTILWEDRGRLERFFESQARCEEIIRENQNRAAVIRQAELSVADQWEAERERAAFARFMEDYGDESLWADHLKANPLPSYPYWRAMFGDPSELSRALDTLISAGVEVWGMTAREVFDLAVSDHGLKPARLRDEIELPEEIVSYRIVRPPEPADDELDDDRGDDDEVDLHEEDDTETEDQEPDQDHVLDGDVVSGEETVDAEFVEQRDVELPELESGGDRN